MKPLQPEQEMQKITHFLKETFRKTGFSKAIIGVSGGVDSAVSLSLSVRALGPKNVYPVLLPYGALSTQGTIDAIEQIQALLIPTKNIIRIDIQPAVEVLSRVVVPDETRKGNIMARVRMIVLFDQAKKLGALVVGTENKTEHHLGYFTRFGDEESDIEPIIHLWKTHVYEIARHVGVIKTILDKAPTAGLWPGQTDEKEFGFTYSEADMVLSLVIEEKKNESELTETGVRPDTIQAVLERQKKNEFKLMTPHQVT